MVMGKTIIEANVTMRGDLSKINIGTYCIVCENSVLKPSDQIADSNSCFVPIGIGDYVVIGRSCVIRASQIGSYVYIGEGSVIGSRCILESCSLLEPQTVLASGTVVPPFCVFGGNPGKKVGQLAPSFQLIMENHCKTYYFKFMSDKRAKEYESTRKKAESQAPEEDVKAE